MNKVSIIVPVYNTEQYLETCLNSLINQTLSNIEIIIVNDGSTDNSKIIINNYKKKYPDKIIVLEKTNGGLSDSRNLGIQQASGKYIGFVDSDDYVDINMYKELYTLAEKNNLDIAECNFTRNYINKTKIDYGNTYKNKQDFFNFGRVMVCNKIFKTSIIKENNIYFPLSLRYEDIEFFYKLIPYINKHENINRSFYYYLQRDSSISHLQNKKNEDIFIVLNNLLNYYKNNNFYNLYEKELEYLFIRLLLGSSFLRIIKIKDKKIKNTLINKTLNLLISTFPNWRKNYLLKNTSMKNIYYKSINKITIKLYSLLFKYK